MKGLVWLDLGKAIRKGVNLGNVKDGMFWVDYRYEKIPKCCYSCGIFGHDEEECVESRIVEESNNGSSVKDLGPSLKARVGGRKVAWLGADPTHGCRKDLEKERSVGMVKKVVVEDLLEKLSRMSMKEQEKGVEDGRRNETMVDVVHKGAKGVLVTMGVSQRNVNKGEVAILCDVMKENVNPLMTSSGGKQWKRLARNMGMTSNSNTMEQKTSKRKSVEDRLMMEIDDSALTLKKERSGDVVMENIPNISTFDHMEVTYGGKNNVAKRCPKSDWRWEDNRHLGRPLGAIGDAHTLTKPNLLNFTAEHVCDLLVEDGSRWDEDNKLGALFDEKICHRILSIPIDVDLGGDRWIWDFDRSGQYTVKMGYRNAVLESWGQLNLGLDIDEEATTRFWKRLWKLPIISRYKVFLWRACRGILPTVELLEERDMDIDELCIMCNNAHEDVFHALIDYPELQLMWVNANFGYMVVYHAWERRNKIIKVEELWPRVERMMEEIQVAAFTDNQNIMELPTVKWKKPEYPFMKLNVDVARSKSSGGAMGGLLRNFTGSCNGVFMSCVRFPSDPILLEAMAIKKGLELAKMKKCTHVVVECDSRMVVDMLHTPYDQASSLNAICKDILRFSEDAQSSDENNEEAAEEGDAEEGDKEEEVHNAEGGHNVYGSEDSDSESVEDSAASITFGDSEEEDISRGFDIPVEQHNVFEIETESENSAVSLNASTSKAQGLSDEESNPKTKIKELVDMAKRKWSQTLKKGKSSRAKKVTLEKIDGSNTEQFKRLFDFYHKLLRSNSISTMKLSTCDAPNMQSLVSVGIAVKFERLYICLDVCKKSFLASRKVLGLDGCFLKGGYGCQLLASVGRDPNDQMLLVAFAIVEVESRDTWSWFLELLINDLGPAGSGARADSTQLNTVMRLSTTYGPIAGEILQLTRSPSFPELKQDWRSRLIWLRNGYLNGQVTSVYQATDKFMVDLQKKECSCRAWMLTGIPCCHSITAMHFMRKTPDDYIPACFRKESYEECYGQIIYLTNGPTFWPSTQFPDVLPPKLSQRARVA
ncbi:putative MULE transposase domain-containing protein [Senna tora]|uniref:Putative MULE transposase domain-containing protein n=1 Tax=Senna tora TaxID=362788 RepID=A0A834W3B2_9FABA|nr:putative MULE transposase domain-containing protein [Senna tora]